MVGFFHPSIHPHSSIIGHSTIQGTMALLAPYPTPRNFDFSHQFGFYTFVLKYKKGGAWQMTLFFHPSIHIINCHDHCRASKASAFYLTSNPHRRQLAWTAVSWMNSIGSLVHLKSSWPLHFLVLRLWSIMLLS